MQKIKLLVLLLASSNIYAHNHREYVVESVEIHTETIEHEYPYDVEYIERLEEHRKEQQYRIHQERCNDYLNFHQYRKYDFYCK